MNFPTLSIIAILLAVMLWLASWFSHTLTTRPETLLSKAKISTACRTAITTAQDAKPPWVPETLIELSRRSPQCGRRALANLFNRTYNDSGVSVGKTYVSDILREYRLTIAQPQRYAHGIDTACPIRTTWGIDMTEHRCLAGFPQLIFGIIDHGSRRVLKLDTIREKSSITLLRLLLDRDRARRQAEEDQNRQRSRLHIVESSHSLCAGSASAMSASNCNAPG